MDNHPEASQARASVGRPAGATIYALEIDNVLVGLINSVEGGEITGEVVEEKISTGYFKKKHLAGVKYEDVSVTANLSLGAVFYDWITNTLQGKYSRKDGRVLTADYNFKVLFEEDYFNALISEVTFPALDAASKDPAYLSIKFSPEYTRYKKASGKMENVSKGQQKKWLPSNFRLAIDGLECKRVSKVDALTVKQTVARDNVGEGRDFLIEPTSLEFPNLVVTLPEVDAQTWLDWHEDFVIKGNNGDAQERNGRLEYRSADLKTVLGTLEFANLGIFKITRDKVEAQSEKVRTITVEMYMEHMTFALGKNNE